MNGNGDFAREEHNNNTFNSLVCFDLETTGLPQFGRVKITEFAFVGVVRSHINANFTALPRVSHKLSFTVYPQKTISLGSSHITGLWNDLLEPIKPWDLKSFEMLLTFLNLLPQPVCVVAHNGYKFDFPIFKQHVQEVKGALPDSIIFVDSLPAFRKILGEDVKKLVEEEDKSSSIIKDMIKDMASENDILIKAAEKKEAELALDGSLKTKQPEVTPDRKTLPNPSGLNEKQRKNMNMDDEVPSSSKFKVRKCLFPVKYPKSYKLCDIYSHLFNEAPEGAHNAEGDAVTLLNCILKVAPDFLKYADENHKTFNSF